MVAVGGAGGGVDETAHLGVARGRHHVQKARDIGVIGGDRVGDRARHRAERGLVQHVVDTFAGTRAIAELADIAFDESKALPGRFAHAGAHFIEIVLMAGRKIVQTGDALVQTQQRFHQIGTDETGRARDEPVRGIVAQMRLKVGKLVHCSCFRAVED